MVVRKLGVIVEGFVSLMWTGSLGCKMRGREPGHSEWEKYAFNYYNVVTSHSRRVAQGKAVSEFESYLLSHLRVQKWTQVHPIHHLSKHELLLQNMYAVHGDTFVSGATRRSGESSR